MFLNNFFTLFFKLPEAIRFILVGGFNTACSYLMFAGLFILLDEHLHYLVIFYLSSFLAISLSFLTLKYFVFQAKGNFMRQYVKTFCVHVTAIAINSILLNFAVSYGGYHPLAAQIVLAVVMAILTYIAHKAFSFRT